jgi:hypothetical protein
MVRRRIGGAPLRVSKKKNTIVEEEDKTEVKSVNEEEKEEEEQEQEESQEQSQEQSQDEKHICILCEDDILKTDKVAEYECGCHKVHTRCGLRSAYFSMRNHGNFTCDTCKTVLFGDNNDADFINDDEAQIIANLENLKIQKPFKEGLKKIKSKRGECVKATSAFKRKLSEEYTKYNNIIQVSVLSIKLAKNEALKAIKKTDEYKAAIRTSSSSTATVNRFKRTFNLGWRETQLLKLNGPGRWRWYRSRPSNMVARKFRIRI